MGGGKGKKIGKSVKPDIGEKIVWGSGVHFMLAWETASESNRSHLVCVWEDRTGETGTDEGLQAANQLLLLSLIDSAKEQTIGRKGKQKFKVR